MTLLTVAAGMGHASVVALLLDAKANVNQAIEVRYSLCGLLEECSQNCMTL